MPPEPLEPRDVAAAESARDLRAPAAVIAAAALFGTTGTAQALGPDGATPLGVGAVRLSIGAAALAIAAAARGSAGRRPWGWRHLPGLAVGGVALATYHLSWFAGLRRTGVALGTIVGIGSSPVFAGLIQLARRRRVSPTWVAGTALTLAGTALIAAHGRGADADLVGLASMLGAGLSYAVYAQAAKASLEQGLDAEVVMASVFGAGALLMAPLLAVEPMRWLATGRGVAMALHLGVLTVGVAYSLYGWALRRLPAPTVVTLTLAEPAVAAILGVAVLGERLHPRGWLGAAVVAAGLLLVGRGERPAVAGRPAHPP